jgi:Tol biopolymer transport system component
MNGIPPRAVVAAVLAIALCLPTHATPAQYLTRPSRKWETIETASFRVHYPAEMRAWVVPVAQRMESYAAAVSSVVGNKPAARVTVMVEDPSNVANGFAIPLLEGPVIFLWPTPPSPTPSFGAYRGWGEALAVHEYAHIAHLTFPSRNPNERRLWSILPARIGPVARKSPAWVIEGFATYIEGRLTGNGRPNGVGRPAILRQWALEGRLPTYGQLDNAAPFLGGAMRYLVGSSFLEWLATRKGEQSLGAIWRRMSARERRTFAEAFRGVYGAGPDDLYGAFYTEVIGKALEAKRELETAGLVEGDLVQKLSSGTGDPAVSKDGSMVALVLRAPNAPSRLVVWRSADEPLDSATLRARRRMLQRDPQDVAPFDSFPPRKKAIATLYPVAGRSYENPRWFVDGERLLVSRDEPLGDGAFRPDLFIWNRKGGGTRRVTHGAGIRQGDPAPDGRSAAGVRCANGICDLVRVDLERGSTTVIAPGSPFVVWHRPRWSPDGRRIAASVHEDGRWRVYVVDAGSTAVRAQANGADSGAFGNASGSAQQLSGGIARPIDPGDGAARFAPSWTGDGRLVVVSERGGVANLELLDPESVSPRTLTRVTGGVAGPDAGPDGRIWFLNLHAKGYDVRRIALDAVSASTAAQVVALDAQLSPVAPSRGAAGLTFAAAPFTGPNDYGSGPRGWRVLPGGSFGPDGDMVSLMVANMDPVGRFTVVAQGGYGEKGAWRGASLATALRSYPAQLEGSAWHSEHAPSQQAAGRFASLDIDSRFTGGGLSARYDRDGGAWSYTVRGGGSVGQVNGNHLDAAGRTMAFAEARGRLNWSWRGFNLSPQLTGQMAQGGTGGDSWRRGLVTGAISFGGRNRSLRAEGTVGRVTEANPGEFGRDFEQFAVGGAPVPFFDQAFLSQRIALPSVPVGYASGRRLALYRLSTQLFGVRPWAIWVAAGDSITHFQRLLGAEKELAFEGIGFARVPATRIRLGVGYSMDEPYKEKIRPYVGVTYRP